MTTERTCDLCNVRVTNEDAQYDLAGRYEFRLVRAKKVSWWRWHKTVRDLDVCAECVTAIGRASFDKSEATSVGNPTPGGEV